MSIDTTNLTATTAELLPALTADRDARVTRAAGQTELACIEMDDAGQGEFSRVITDREASELVRLGVVRDARDDDDSLVCGTQIQLDRSGQGHAWKDIDADDIPANIREEIECEILDGGKDECGSYFASNGLHYRW